MKYGLFLIFALFALPVFGDVAVLRGEFRWTMEDDKFGGFSGLEVSADGVSFTTISDRGSIINGRFIRADGQITDVDVGPLSPIQDTNSNAVSGYRTNAEGLAVDEHGRLFISFEGDHRVWQYEKPGGRATALRGHKGFAELQNNSGLEALAIDTEGTLYTLPERSGDWERPFPVFRYRGGVWDNSLSIPRHGKFLPVGADFGPDGWFYLLERNFVWYAGFLSRIRRFQVTEKGFANEEVLLTTSFGRHGNLEGIAVWRDDQGGIRLTMIADDNFSALLDTVIVEYSLVPED